MSRPSTSTISVVRLACCADDSSDLGSCRIRLPASVWAAAGIPYHKPVIVSIPCDGFSEPWRLLCVAALPSVDDPSFDAAGAEQQRDAPAPQQALTLTPPPQAAKRQPRPQQQTPRTPPPQPQLPQPQQQQTTTTTTSTTPHRRAPTVSAAAAAVDPTVALPPPGASMTQLRNLIWASTGLVPPAASVTACRGQGVMAASEARVRVAPGQEHLVSPRMSFKLHQALVLPGCWLRMSASSYVEVVSVLPELPYSDQPLRIVPSTRLTLVGHIGEPYSQPQPQVQPQSQLTENPQEQQQQQAGVMGGLPTGSDDDEQRQPRVPSHRSVQGSPCSHGDGGLATASTAPGTTPKASAQRKGSTTGRAKATGVQSSPQPPRQRTRVPEAGGVSTEDGSTASGTGPDPGFGGPEESTRGDIGTGEGSRSRRQAAEPVLAVAAAVAVEPSGSALATPDGVGSRSGPAAATATTSSSSSKPRKSKSKAQTESGGEGGGSSRSTSKSKSKSGSGKGSKAGGIAASASLFDALLGLDDD